MNGLGKEVKGPCGSLIIHVRMKNGHGLQRYDNYKKIGKPERSTYFLETSFTGIFAVRTGARNRRRLRSGRGFYDDKICV